MSPWFEAFHYGYLLKAMLAAGVVGAACGLLSCFIILKGWSLMGDALSHAVVPGVALAWIAGLPFSLGAFVAAMLAALNMGWLERRSSLRRDAIIGVVFTGYFAFGLILLSKFPSPMSLRSIVLGNLLTISPSDLWQVMVISGLSVAIVLMRWRDLFLCAFDPVQAAACGLNSARLQWLLLALLSATTVAALQAVGACLVIAMLMTPGATARLLSDRFGCMLGLAAGSAALCAVAGAWLSHGLNASIGGCIVLLQTLLFFVALVLAPRRGLLAGWRARRLPTLTHS